MSSVEIVLNNTECSQIVEAIQDAEGDGCKDLSIKIKVSADKKGKSKLKEISLFGTCSSKYNTTILRRK